MVEIGGNIELINFDDLEPERLIVAKKMIGNYVKKIADSKKDFEKIIIELKNKEKNEVKGNLTIAGKETVEEVSDKNLFFALDKLLSKLDKA